MDFDKFSATQSNANSSVITDILSPAVYIVGAGPGDPELLTVKAQRLIQKADVLVYANSLVPTQILSEIRPDAEKIATANMTLEDIVPLMIDRVRAGKSVVRLHSGDPSLYSAIHEQMIQLADADVPFEVIPGISAFQAAAANLQVELTIPAVVQSIILTRISGRTQVPVAEELASLAAHKASLCLYLSARHIHEAQKQLLVHYPPQTPVAICFRVGWPDGQIQVVPLEKMAEVSKAEDLVRTTLYIISPALARATGTVDTDGNGEKNVRSRLYSPTHDHLFRPRVGQKQTATKQTAQQQTTTPEKPLSAEQRKNEQEQAKK
ncbi:MAG: precorrin-4 C(11)-methyltransferase [Cyanobacteria bacterium P01_F01_bin.53]